VLVPQPKIVPTKNVCIAMLKQDQQSVFLVS
jgi:hypothetical protein